MKMFKHMITAFAVFAICASLAGAEDEAAKETKQAKEAKQTTAKVPAALKGKLIEYKDGKIQDAKISADMDYYVLYHSASW